MKNKKAQLYSKQALGDQINLAEQVIIMTPIKQCANEKTESNSFIKFKSSQLESAYLPKFRLSPISNKISIVYLYRVSATDHIGNLQEWSQSKPWSLSPSNSKNTIIQSKRKGLRQYTMSLKINNEKPEAIENKQLSAACISPFQTDKLLNYFEVKLMLPLAQNTKPSFSFGITTDHNFPNNQKTAFSIRFQFSEGTLKIFRNCIKTQQIQDFNIKIGDVIGCGLIYHRNQVILTFNGKMILYKFKLNASEEIQQKQKKSFLSIRDIIKEHKQLYYPFITFQSKKISVETVFQNSYTNFCFPFIQYLTLLQNKLIQEQMQKQSRLTEQNMYGLALNYMKYYGYQNTAELLEKEMMSKNMKFYPQNQPIQNKICNDRIIHQQSIFGSKKNSKEKKIKKKTKKLQITDEDEEDNQMSSHGQMQEQRIQIQNNFPYKDSSDSQNDEWVNPSFDFGQFGDLTFSNILGKKSNSKTLQNQQQINEQKRQINKKRKEQVTQLKHKKIQKKIEGTRKIQQEKFKNVRIQIIKDIKIGKLEQAYKQMLRSYKKICKKQNYLEAFFKANIFLKYFDQNGLSKALQYTKKQQKCFTQYQNYLFPFFNNQSSNINSQKNVIFRPLREILFLICPQNKKQFKFQCQLEVFAQFINSILCQGCGFMSNSKLQLVLSHYNLIQRKINEFQIPIGGIDLQQMNCT